MFIRIEEDLLRFIYRTKSIHGIVIPITCGYKNHAGKTGFNVTGMFDQNYFAIPVNHNKLH